MLKNSCKMNKNAIFNIKSNDEEFIQLVLSPGTSGLLINQLDDVMKQFDGLKDTQGVTNDQLLFAKVFVSDYINQSEEIHSHPLFTNRFHNCAVTVIEQPPLNGRKINILLWFAKGVKIDKELKEDALIARVNNNLHIFQAVRDERPGKNLRETTELLFQKHQDLLQEYGMSVDNNCVRTWLFVRDVDTEYMDVVEGRNKFFDDHGLTKDTHFIASTGIEGGGTDLSSSLNIDFYSIQHVENDDKKYLQALEYLNPTHEYGVAFERAVSYSLTNWRFIFISGTASIDKCGEILYEGDVISQLERVFVNMKELLADDDANLTDLSHLIVYIRDISDYQQVDNYIKSNYKSIPYVIVYAKVCRPGWLIEIESLGIVKKQ